MERVILKVHWQCQSYMYDQNVDLGDFCELLHRECGLVLEELGEDDETAILMEVQDRCKDVLDELKRAVILSGFSGGAYQYSNGISVFFPWSREGYAVSRKNYESLWFTKDASSRRFAWTGFLKKYLNEVALRKFEPTTPDAAPGAKYRYPSGIRFEERVESTPGGNGGPMTKMPGQEASKMPGQEGSKMPGQEGSKMPGQEGSKMPGQEGSKMPGQEGSKMPGQEGSKMPGQEGSKMPGQEGSKMAGGGSNAFFDNLRLFKNIESRWNISGFTKKPDEPAPESEKADVGLPTSS